MAFFDGAVGFGAEFQCELVSISGHEWLANDVAQEVGRVQDFVEKKIFVRRYTESVGRALGGDLDCAYS
jgi:hypothetical protein